MTDLTSTPASTTLNMSTSERPDEMAIDFERQQFFWSRVRQEGDHLIWDGMKVPRGYGKIQIGNKVEYAHRVSYCIAHGLDLRDIADKTILILCERNDCVEPTHLATKAKKK